MTEAKHRKIRIFDSVVAKVLSDLYQSFPDPFDLDSGKIGMTVVEEDKSYEEMWETITTTAKSSIDYLIREGIVTQAHHYSTWDGADCKAAVLTEKGLRLLREVPESVDTNRDTRELGARIADAVQGGKWGIAAQLIREMQK